MHNHDNVISKITKLTERVNHTINIPSDGKSSNSDLIWCKRLLDDVQNSGLVPNEEEFIMANLMWKKYNGGVPISEKTIWILIDTLLEQGTKIGAIKMYRRFINSSLREAKDVVDARQISKEKEWTK